MRSKNRFSGTARLIRTAAVLAMFPIAADGFAPDGVAARRACGPDIFGCGSCTNAGLRCTWLDGDQWCKGVIACADCLANPQADAILCLTPFQ